MSDVTNTWNERYDTEEFVYGREPNAFLAGVSAMMPPGDVLCLAEGEGRNAVFLARQGHRVLAVDASAVGLSKAARLAEEHGVRIETLTTDLADLVIEPGRWDAIVSIFCHVPPPVRRVLHRQAVAGLRPGGLFVLEAYTPAQLELRTGGPHGRAADDPGRSAGGTGGPRIPAGPGNRAGRGGRAAPHGPGRRGADRGAQAVRGPDSMRITLIAAMAENRVIGNRGAIPWHLPDDLARFRAITLGHPVLMGRRTFESIGRPLPGRLNIVLSHREGYAPPGCLVARDLAAALELARDAAELFVCGGGELYREALPLADRILLTLVRGEFPGDVTFPEVPADFVETAREEGAGEPAHLFLTYERRKEAP